MYYPVSVTIHKRACPNCGNVFSSSLLSPAVRLGCGKRTCESCKATFSDGTEEWSNLDLKSRRLYVLQGIDFLGLFFLLLSNLSFFI